MPISEETLMPWGEAVQKSQIQQSMDDIEDGAFVKAQEIGYIGNPQGNPGVGQKLQDLKPLDKGRDFFKLDLFSLFRNLHHILSIAGVNGDPTPF